MSKSKYDYENRIQRAAVRFASDYGPLPAALQGDEKARAAVADHLAMALMAEGFDLVPKESKLKLNAASPIQPDEDAAQAGAAMAAFIERNGLEHDRMAPLPDNCVVVYRGGNAICFQAIHEKPST